MGSFMCLNQWVAWSHYNSIPCRRLFNKWAYCITKTMRESSLSASRAEKVLKNLLVYFWFIDNLLNIHNDLRAGTFSFARKRNTVLVEFVNIVAFTSIMDLQQLDTMMKAKLVYTIIKAEKLSLQFDAKDIDTFCASIGSLEAPCTSTRNVMICDYVSWRNFFFWWDQNRSATF